MKKRAVLGTLLTILGLAVFAGYFLMIFEVLQGRYIVLGRHPSLISATLVGGMVGIIFGSLVYIGNALRKDKFFGIEHTEFSWKDLLSSKAWKNWAIGWSIGFAGISFGWALWTF